MGKRWVAGFGVTAFLGLGGGAAVHALGRSMAPMEFQAAAGTVEDQRIHVQRVEGAGLVLGDDGQWRRVAPGQVLTAPVALKTQGMGTRVLVSFRGIRLMVMHDAMVLLGGGGGSASVQVESGLVLLRRAGREIRATVPSRLLTADGVAYGVWVLENQVMYSVLDGELELVFRDEKPQRFARAREVVANGKSLAPSVLESTLVIDELRSEKKGKSYLIQARAAPNVLVFQKKGDKLTPIPVSAAGIFEVNSDTPKLSPTEIFALDAAGRVVQPGQTSQSIAQILAYLDPQASVAEPPAAPAPAPEVPAPAPEVAPELEKVEAAPTRTLPQDKVEPAPEEEPSEAPEKVVRPIRPEKPQKSETAERARGRGDDTPQPLKVEVPAGARSPDVSLEKPEATLPKSRIVPPEAPPPTKKPPPDDEEDDGVDERAL